MSILKLSLMPQDHQIHLGTQLRNHLQQQVHQHPPLHFGNYKVAVCSPSCPSLYQLIHVLVLAHHPP